jgi:hypothetical protein
MASYALLGGELLPSNTEGLEVHISINPNGAEFRSSLVLKPDQAKVGLPSDYAHAIFGAIEELSQSTVLPSRAKLRLQWAAHSEIGSSPSSFNEAAKLVVRLLALPSGPTENLIKSLFG